MSAPSRPLKVLVCSECGKQVEEVVGGHFHGTAFKAAEEVEVIPLADAQKVEAELVAERSRAENALATAERYRLKFAKGQEDAVADVEADFEGFKERLNQRLRHFESEANAADELASGRVRGVTTSEVDRYEAQRDTYRYVLEQLAIAASENPEGTEEGSR